MPITHPISNFAPNVVFDITAGAGVATDRTPVFTVNGTEVELTWNVVEDRGFALLSTAERLGPSPEVYVFEVRYWDNNGREFTYGWNVTTAGGPGVPAPPTPTP